jgi:hypothetical protein
MSDRFAGDKETIQRLNGQPAYLGKVTATTTTGTYTTGLRSGMTILVQPSAAVRIAAGSTATTDDVKLAADEKFVMVLKTGTTTLSVITDSSTSVVRFYELA